MKTKILFFLILILSFISVPGESKSENSYSVFLINLKSGFSDKIIIYKKAKNVWMAKRIFNGKERVVKRIKEKDYYMIRIRMNTFMRKAKSEKLSPECPELFEAYQREEGPPKTHRGCAVDRQDFAHLFLSFLKVFY